MRETRACTHGVRKCITAFFSTLFLLAPAVAQAQTVTAAWDPSPAADQVTGYQVCVGTSSLSCNVALASVSASTTSYTFTPSGGALYYIAIRATNAAGASPYSSEVAFSIPGFTQPLNQSSPAGTAITALNLSVSDPDGDSLTFTHTGLPPGLSLNGSTGRITGTPSAAGTYNVTVFVGDGLATVSRSFVWTVTGTTSDTTAPAVTITSHTSGQTLTSASVTISGTATDSGRGGTGVTSVTVNGQVATGGTVSNSSTANWSRALTLSSGANTISVEATDGAGNSNMQQITLNLNLPVAPVTGATLTANIASPEDAGTTITFTAAGSGGVGPRQYKFRVAQGGGAAQTVQNWSTTATYAWTPTTAATYTVSVWVRSASATADVAQASAQTAYVINTPAAVVSAGSVTPSSGSGAAQTFALQYLNSGGASSMSRAWVWFNASFGSVSSNSCLLYYDRPAGKLNLLTNDGTTWMPGTLGTNALLQNSQCSVALASSSVSLSGTALMLNLAMTFSGSYVGSKHVYLYGANTAGVNSGWQDRGDWTVLAPASAPPPVVSPGGAVTAVSVTPSAGSGTIQTFALQYAESGGASNLKTAWVWFNETFASSAANSCMFYYDRPAARLYMLNDAGTAWQPGVLGSGSSLQNSQCSVALAGSSVSTSGTNLTLNLAMTFRANYAGAKQVYLYGANASGVNSGWQDRGDWTVPSSSSSSPVGVSAVSATPSNGSGATRTFALQYGDSTGAANLATAWVWFNSSFASSAAGSCLVYYDRVANRLYLLNDAGNVWMPGVPGSGSVLANTQCQITLNSSFVSVSGTTLTLNLAMSFRPQYAGSKNIYMYANNAGGASSGWQQRGSWIVP